MGRPQRYRGVRQRHWGSWVSEIRHPLLKTRVWLGTFETAEDAAHAYDEAARLMCGVKARTNFPYDPKRPSTQLLSATLTAKLHRWYLQSQQQESQPGAAKAIKGAAAAQSLTCLCLDNQQSNLGIYHKKPGCKEQDSDWVRNVEFATPTTTASADDPPQSSASSFTSDNTSCWSEEDKFAAEMIEELLSWSHSSSSSSFTSQLDSSCSSPFTASSSSSSATFVM